MKSGLILAASASAGTYPTSNTVLSRDWYVQAMSSLRELVSIGDRRMPRASIWEWSLSLSTMPMSGISSNSGSERLPTLFGLDIVMMRAPLSPSVARKDYTHCSKRASQTTRWATRPASGNFSSWSMGDVVNQSSTHSDKFEFLRPFFISVKRSRLILRISRAISTTNTSIVTSMLRMRFGTLNDALCEIYWAGPKKQNIGMGYICENDEPFSLDNVSLE